MRKMNLAITYKTTVLDMRKMVRREEPLRCLVKGEYFHQII